MLLPTAASGLRFVSHSPPCAAVLHVPVPELTLPPPILDGAARFFSPRFLSRSPRPPSARWPTAPLLHVRRPAQTDDRAVRQRERRVCVWQHEATAPKSCGGIVARRMKRQASIRSPKSLRDTDNARCRRDAVSAASRFLLARFRPGRFAKRSFQAIYGWPRRQNPRATTTRHQNL